MGKMSPVDYAMHYGSGCRDCADADGICPDRGTPCDPTIFRRVVEHAVTAFTYGIKHGFMENPFVTAPNTPTPELEQSAIAIKLIKIADASRREDGTDIPLGEQCRQAAAAIAKLTAERDSFEARLISCDANLTHTLKEYTEMTLERDRAERRVKELEALIDGENCADPDKIDTLFRRAETAEAANKPLSERVVVLEAMLQELKAATGHDDGLLAIRHLVLRATQAEDYITAREAK